MSKTHKAHKDKELDHSMPDAASFGECTGLMPTPPQSDADREAYEDIFGVAYKQKDTE